MPDTIALISPTLSLVFPFTQRKENIERNTI